MNPESEQTGGGFQPIIEEQEEQLNEVPEERELEIENETKEDSIIIRGDNLPIVDLSKYNTKGKGA